MRTKKIQAKKVAAGDTMLYAFKTANQKTYHVQEMHFDPKGRPPGIDIDKPGFVTLVLTQKKGQPPETLFFKPDAPITVRI
jgi:hypothetical protein